MLSNLYKIAWSRLGTKIGTQSDNENIKIYGEYTRVDFFVPDFIIHEKILYCIFILLLFYDLAYLVFPNSVLDCKGLVV